MKNKYIPERMCCACKKRDDKNSFFKVLLSENQKIVDDNKSFNGKGIYICKSKECIKKMLKNRKSKINENILNELYERLENI